jgi:hypothetical protein
VSTDEGPALGCLVLRRRLTHKSPTEPAGTGPHRTVHDAGVTPTWPIVSPRGTSHAMNGTDVADRQRRWPEALEARVAWRATVPRLGLASPVPTGGHLMVSDSAPRHVHRSMATSQTMASAPRHVHRSMATSQTMASAPRHVHRPVATLRERVGAAGGLATDDGSALPTAPATADASAQLRVRRPAGYSATLCSRLTGGALRSTGRP